MFGYGMNEEEFERKHNEIARMIHIGNIYMLIRDKSLALNSLNYKNLGNSQEAFKEFAEIIDDSNDKEFFSKVIADNDKFLDSVHESVFGDIEYDTILLQKVIDEMRFYMSKIIGRLSKEQMNLISLEVRMQYLSGEYNKAGFVL